MNCLTAYLHCLHLPLKRTSSLWPSLPCWLRWITPPVTTAVIYPPSVGFLTTATWGALQRRVEWPYSHNRKNPKPETQKDLLLNTLSYLVREHSHYISRQDLALQISMKQIRGRRRLQIWSGLWDPRASPCRAQSGFCNESFCFGRKKGSWLGGWYLN